jgi:hypothetical protein
MRDSVFISSICQCAPRNGNLRQTTCSGAEGILRAEGAVLVLRPRFAQSGLLDKVAQECLMRFADALQMYHFALWAVAVSSEIRAR